MNAPHTGDQGQDRDTAFTVSLEQMSLTELQDVFGHLDRDRYPERIEAVRRQMHARIDQLNSATGVPEASDATSGVFRRLWGSALDVFVSLFPLVLYFGISMLAGGGSSGGGGGGRGGRGGRGRGRAPEESFLDKVTDYLTSPEAIWESVTTYGPYVAIFIAYRALYVLPQLVRSGSLPGMREAGVRVVSEDGTPLTYARAGKRFALAYLLGMLTLGVSHLWACWDEHQRALFDKIAGTRVVRLARHWEKPPEQRILED